LFVHIGGNHVIQSETIVTIVDRDLVTSSTIMEEMMTGNTKKEIVFGSISEAKSIVITTDSIYCSSLSVPTLQKRASMISTISKLEDYSEEIELD